jgi:O-antigen/teichoic acid export membrane protein
MSAVKTIARNTIFLAVSQAITIALGFFYIMYIARYLRVDGYGILSIALVFSSICLMLTDFGLNTLTTREIAKDRSLTDKYFGNVAIIKLLLFIASLAVILVATVIFRYPLRTLEVIFIVVFSMIFSSLNNMLNSIFQAYEVMGYQSVGSIINSAVSFFGVLAVIQLNLGILGVAALYLLSNGANFLYSFLIYRRKFNMPRITADLPFIKTTFRESIPFGLTSVFSTLYVSIDVIILSIVWGNDAVGVYSAAGRLSNYLGYIPTIINIAVLPIMARYYVSSNGGLKLIVEKYTKLMLIIAVPTGIGVTILADKIISFIYGGGYAPSVEILRIFIWTMMLAFISAAYVRLFESIGKQSFITKVSLISLIINFTCNVLLIPRYGYIGAATTAVITQLIATTIIYFYAYKSGYGIEVFKIAKFLYKIVISTLAMVIFITVFYYINIVILIIASIFVYTVTLLILKEVDSDDIVIIKNILKRD